MVDTMPCLRQEREGPLSPGHLFQAPLARDLGLVLGQDLESWMKAVRRWTVLAADLVVNVHVLLPAHVPALLQALFLRSWTRRFDCLG